MKIKIIDYSNKRLWVVKMECPNYMCGAILEFDALDDRICPSCGKVLTDTILDMYAEVIGEITRDKGRHFDRARKDMIPFYNPIKYSEYIKYNEYIKNRR